MALYMITNHSFDLFFSSLPGNLCVFREGEGPFLLFAIIQDAKGKVLESPCSVCLFIFPISISYSFPGLLSK